MSAELLPYLAGPGGAIIVCVLVGWGSYQLLVSKVLPIVEAAVARHLAQIDEMNSRWIEADRRNAEEHAKIMEMLVKLDTKVDKSVGCKLMDAA